MKFCACALLALLATLPVASAQDQSPHIIVASTTSTENTGLFQHLAPLFRTESGIELRVVAVGTGQAFAIARKGDADVLLVHDTAGEEQFIREGFGLEHAFRSLLGLKTHALPFSQ
jgi:tungstate transport system substrate-binding protein